MFRCYKKGEGQSFSSDLHFKGCEVPVFELRFYVRLALEPTSKSGPSGFDLTSLRASEGLKSIIV